jgi:hypothetical protein
VHEVLGVARGHARVQFGGDHGKALDIAAGDVAILPAGTGHQLISASEDFCVVGAYPPGPPMQITRPTPENHAKALKTIPEVKLPKTDPVRGEDGPLVRLWKRGGRRRPHRHCGRRNSPLLQPTAPELSGSDASVLVSVWPHLAHSNVRCSKPSGPSATANVIIRAWQSGHRGRCIGKSSGGGFSTPSMTSTPRWLSLSAGQRPALWAFDQPIPAFSIIIPNISAELSDTRLSTQN